LLVLQALQASITLATVILVAVLLVLIPLATDVLVLLLVLLPPPPNTPLALTLESSLLQVVPLVVTDVQVLL